MAEPAFRGYLAERFSFDALDFRAQFGACRGSAKLGLEGFVNGHERTSTVALGKRLQT